MVCIVFFFRAEDGIRDGHVTGVQTCALPISEVLGEKAYASLKEVDHTIDIINVFRRPEHLPEIAKEAAQTDCRVFWAQQGIVNEAASEYLKERDFTVIMDMCIKVAHAMLIK